MHIGALIHLSNSYCDTYEVIGVNHNGTTNTVDIMPTTQVGNSIYGSSTTNYGTSALRSWINSTYIQAFSSNIQNLMKLMEIKTSSGKYYDKAKIMSPYEWGATFSNPYISTAENDEQYSCFTSGEETSAISDRWRGSGTHGNSLYIYSRAYYTPSSPYVWVLSSAGNFLSSPQAGNSTAYGILPVLRF